VGVVSHLKARGGRSVRAKQQAHTSDHSTPPHGAAGQLAFPKISRRGESVSLRRVFAAAPQRRPRRSADVFAAGTKDTSEYNERVQAHRGSTLETTRACPRRPGKKNHTRPHLAGPPGQAAMPSGLFLANVRAAAEKKFRAYQPASVPVKSKASSNDEPQ
jgi:hypothetical protein